MPSFDIKRTSTINRSARVVQVEGMFDVPSSKKSELSWKVNLPLEGKDWNIGLIVGPSGCGKSTLAREAFPEIYEPEYSWNSDNSLLDDFPQSMGVKEIVSLLSSVGFSSPPSWLRPYSVLSTGEKFRVSIARAMAESEGMFLVDEFTSVVDRTVAQIGSAAIAKAVRRSGRQFVAVGCHYDVVEWLQPDWVYEPASNKFSWRSLRRHPEIHIDVWRVDKTAWKLFSHHHYLDHGISPSAKCFVGFVNETPAVFGSVIFFPHPKASSWRGHRTVCLPDFQGVGIGNKFAELIGSIFRATGKKYSTTTSHPAMIYHRAKSKLWHMNRKPSRLSAHRSSESLAAKDSSRRRTAGFRYVGPINETAARVLIPEKF